MSQATSQSATGSVGSISPSFWARKLHSLTGVVPIGAFLAEHFWTNSYAAQGPQAFNDAVEKLRSIPYVLGLEIFGIWIPILYHALYGIVIAMQGRPNSLKYPWGRNWMYMLQRLSGVILLFYIGLHVYETRIESAMKGVPVTFEYMVEELSEPGAFLFYTTGVLSAVFHFTSGLWAFLIGWGITVTQSAMRKSAYVCAGIGLILGTMGMNSLLGFFGKSFFPNF